MLLLGDHVYQYDLNKRTFRIATEQEGQDIIGALLPITNHENYTYLNDTKRIYQLDKRNNRLTSLFRCFNDTVINSVARDEYGDFWIGSNYGLIHYNPATKVRTPFTTTLFTEVTLIVCDQQGKVWFGTNDMLFAWLIKEKRNSYCSANRMVPFKTNIFPNPVC